MGLYWFLWNLTNKSGEIADNIVTIGPLAGLVFTSIIAKQMNAPIALKLSCILTSFVLSVLEYTYIYMYIQFVPCLISF